MSCSECCPLPDLSQCSSAVLASDPLLRSADGVWGSGVVRSLVRRYEELGPPCLDETYTVPPPVLAATADAAAVAGPHSPAVLSCACSQSSVDTWLTGARPRTARLFQAAPTASFGRNISVVTAGRLIVWDMGLALYK